MTTNWIDTEIHFLTDIYQKVWKSRACSMKYFIKRRELKGDLFNYQEYQGIKLFLLIVEEERV